MVQLNLSWVTVHRAVIDRSKRGYLGTLPYPESSNMLFSWVTVHRAFKDRSKRGYLGSSPYLESSSMLFSWETVHRAVNDFALHAFANFTLFTIILHDVRRYTIKDSHS